jgi:hypothetical protein
MQAIKKAKKIIGRDISTPLAKVLSGLIVSLETDEAFDIKQIFDLPNDDFELVLDILKEWKIDRFYMGKAKTFAAAYFAKNLNAS